MTISDPNELPPELRGKPSLQAAIKVDVPVDGDGRVDVRLLLTRRLDEVEWHYAGLISGAMAFVDAETVVVRGYPSALLDTLNAANEVLADIAQKAVDHRALADRSKVEAQAVLEQFGL